jgi:hypothetical protein
MQAAGSASNDGHALRAGAHDRLSAGQALRSGYCRRDLEKERVVPMAQSSTSGDVIRVYWHPG